MSFAPEDRLLLACAGAPFRPDGSEHVRPLLRADLDWEYVLEASIRHAVSPLVDAALRAAAPTDELGRIVPQDVARELRELREMTRARSRRLYGDLAEIAASFNRAGVAALALKEIPLALEAYPDPGLRPIGDIDLLIRAQQYDRASQCLRTRGFEPLPHPELPYTRKYASAHHFRRPEDEVWVDLQWNVASREWDLHDEGSFTFDPETLWDGASSLDLGGAVLSVPRPEPMLFHLCLHAEGHEYSELILFADIVALLAHRAESFNWDTLRRIAEGYGAEASVYYVLLLSQRLLHAPVPEGVLRRLEPRYVTAGMLTPLFGNLTQLHLSLDDVRSLARPPAELLDEMELVVRRQAAAARELYKEVDGVVSSFKDLGGDVVVVEGTPPERTFPDAALGPFGELSIVVLQKDRARIERSLAERGFMARETESDGEPVRGYAKTREISSRDPVLRGRRTLLDIECEFERGRLDAGPHDSGDRRSKKDAALAVVRARLGDQKGDAERLTARLMLVSLSAEEALVYLCSRLVGRSEGRVFALLTLLELFRARPEAVDELDLQNLVTVASRAGSRQSACEGLAIVEEVLGSERLAPALEALGCPGAEPRVLEWARYGPGSLEQYGRLKRGFFVLYTVLALRGFRARARYLLRALFGGREHRPFAHLLLPDLLRVAVAAGRPKTYTTRDLAFWIEPDALTEEGPGSRRSLPSPPARPDDDAGRG